MSVRVRTGSTASPQDVLQVSLAQESLHGEQVLLLVAMTAREREGMAVERECEAILKHALLESEGDAEARLDGTLKELNGLLKGVFVSGAIQDAHMLVAVLEQSGVLHVSHAGRGEAYLIRHGTASQITELSNAKPTPAFVHIASGGLEEGDLLVLSTQRLLRAITPAQLTRLTADRDATLEAIVRALEAEAEHAALATIDVLGLPSSARTGDGSARRPSGEPRPASRPPLVDRRRRMQGVGLPWKLPSLSLTPFSRLFSSLISLRTPGMRRPARPPERSAGRARSGGRATVAALGHAWTAVRAWVSGVLQDLHDPRRKRRAHLLILASALALLIIVWSSVRLFTSTQRSKTRVELEELVSQINVEIQTAENRRVMGDTDAANAILQRAEERAKQVMDNESGLFRVEANELLGRIRSKREEINNIIRVSPRVVAHLGANNPDVLAQGLIGLGDGEFVVYDRQGVYRVLLNSVEAPHRLSEDQLIVAGTNFPRFQTLVFLLNDNSVLEWQSGQAVTMKTDDPRGWINGVAAKAYLRYLYILSPENRQIFKYERTQNRYSAPAEYNVNGDLTGALDMAIDGSVYVLKDNGTILRLFRGEDQRLVLRRQPQGVLDDATKIFKVPDRNMYVLDPTKNRVIVFSDGATNEALYLKQYVFEGEQVGTLKDLYVDPDEAHLYVSDEKRIYVMDLAAK